MNVKSLVLAGAAGSLLAGAASAAFVGFNVFEYAVDGNGVDPVLLGTTTHRVYVVFDNMDDQLTAAGGTPDEPVDIYTVNNGDFYQDPFGSDFAHNAVFEDAFPALHYDTYVTIGSVDTGVDGPTGVAGNWNDMTNGTLFQDDAGWFRNPDDPVTYAGDDYQVLLAQFTVPTGDQIKGWVKFSATVDGTGDTFYEFIPAPGAFALLGLAGLVSRRRR